ncbi:MAG: hypothetical protein KDA61_16640 [Planctomycetales bacterium]|nr:hypothetical protein [Planctomycetales bacterium]
MSAPLCRFACFSLLMVGLAGCGSDGPFDYVPVSGRLTYDDGTPIPAAGIMLQFVAQDAPLVEGAHPRPATANLDETGSFSCATSHKYGDGLIPGKHKVAVFYAVDAAGRSLVPQEYTHVSNSPLVVDTAAAPLEIHVPRP